MPRANANSRHAYNRTFQAGRKAALRAQGKCLDCGREDALPSRRDPSKPGARCGACAVRARQASRNFMARRREGARAFKVCVICLDNPSIRATHPESTDNRCGACADQQLEYKEQKKHGQARVDTPPAH